MKSEQVVTRITSFMMDICDDIDTQDVKRELSLILSDYSIEDREKSLALNYDIREHIFMYLATKRTEGIKDVSLKNYAQTLKSFSDVVKKDVKEINQVDIRMYLATEMQRNLSKATLANKTTHLKSFFKWLYNEEVITKDITLNIKQPSLNKDAREPLNKEEFEQLRQGCKTLRDKAVLEVMYSTGCRASEVINVKKKDIDWQNLSIDIIGKGDKRRTVYLSSISKIHLQKYLMNRLDKSEYLFVTERKPNKKLSRRTLGDILDRIQENSLLDKHIHPHLIRHTMATHLYQNGMDILSIQRILGHEQLSTTQIYVKIDKKEIEYQFKKYI